MAKDLGNVVGPMGLTGPRGETGAKGDPGDDTYTETTNAGYAGTRAQFYTALSGVGTMERTSNRVSSITGTSTNEQYPTAKAVYDLFTSIEDGNEIEF